MLDRRRPSDVYKVPSVLWRLVDFLMRPGAIETPNLFLLAGDRVVSAKLMDALDLHIPFDDALYNEDGYYAAAELILRFVEALPDSLIPSQYFDACLAVSNDRMKTFKLVGDIPEQYYLLFEYILRFFRDYLLARNVTVQVDPIVHLMAVMFIRKPNHAKLSANEASSMFNFFSHFFR